MCLRSIKTPNLHLHCPYITWLAEVHILTAWVCQTHRLHCGAPVSRSEWTEVWRLWPLGTAPDGGINVYCCSAPPERNDSRHWGFTSTLWSNIVAISMNCLQCYLFILSVCIIVVLFICLYISHTACLQCIPLFFKLLFYFLTVSLCDSV